MMRLSDLDGLKVVSRFSAEDAGTVKDVLVDARTQQVLALRVGKRHAQLVDWSALTGLGPDAAVVGEEAALRDPADEREQAFLKGHLSLLGKRVLSEQGNDCGTIRDADLDETSGRLLAVHVEQGTIAASRLWSLGSFALVVTSDASADIAG